MTKKTTGNTSQPTISADVIGKMADPSTMLHATKKANAGRNPQHTNAYFYGGSLGDSIERRLAPGS
jgi:hypothetical protein